MTFQWAFTPRPSSRESTRTTGVCKHHVPLVHCKSRQDVWYHILSWYKCCWSDPQARPVPVPCCSCSFCGVLPRGSPCCFRFQVAWVTYEDCRQRSLDTTTSPCQARIFSMTCRDSRLADNGTDGNAAVVPALLESHPRIRRLARFLLPNLPGQGGSVDFRCCARPLASTTSKKSNDDPAPSTRT